MDLAVPPVSYDTPEKHPLSLYVKGDLVKRGQLLQHPHVESLLFVSQDKLHELFCPKLVTAFDVDNPTDCPNKLGGVIGDNLLELATLSFSAEDTFGDTVLLHKEHESPFRQGVTIPVTSFHAKKDDKLPIAPFIHSISIMSFPLFIPKTRGVKIVTGDIKKFAVKIR